MSFRCIEGIPDGAEHTEWLEVIWECNRRRRGTFGRPENKPWWAGGMVEDYAEARVIFVGDDTVRMVGKSPEVDQLITQVAVDLGFLHRQSYLATEALGPERSTA